MQSQHVSFKCSVVDNSCVFYDTFTSSKIWFTLKKQCKSWPGTLRPAAHPFFVFLPPAPPTAWGRRWPDVPLEVGLSEGRGGLPAGEPEERPDGRIKLCGNESWMSESWCAAGCDSFTGWDVRSHYGHESSVTFAKAAGGLVASPCQDGGLVTIINPSIITATTSLLCSVFRSSAGPWTGSS